MFPFEDPTQSGPSQSLSRSAGAAGACDMASAAGLTHKMSTSVTSFFLSFVVSKKMIEKVITPITVNSLCLRTELTEVLRADPDGEVLLRLL